MTPTITPEAARLAEERQRFEAACKLHGWTPGDFMLGAYAGWLAAKQDAAPTSASTVPAGFWLAPMEMNASMHGAAVQAHASFGIKYSDKPERIWVAVRDSYLARNPGACSVTDGEAKK